MPNQCTANPAMPDPASGPGWNGWSNDLANTRFQPAAAARLTAADVPRLKLKWAFGFPHGETNNAQPTVVVGPRVHGQRQRLHLLARRQDRLRLLVVPERLDRPQFADGRRRQRPGQRALGGVLRRRPRQRLRPRRADRPAALEGARRRSRRRAHHRRRRSTTTAASTCRSRARRSSTAASRTIRAARRAAASWRSTRTPASRSGRPTTSTSRSRGRRTRTACSCTGPSAGGIWNAPTIDTVRGALYVGTGDAVTPPESPLTDAVMALDLKTGKVLWSCRASEDDLFMGGCAGPNASEAVPEPMGPDADIGNSPILVTLANGKRALFVGTKAADVLALDPDTNGALLFQVNPSGQPAASRARPRRIVWGGAADGRQRLLRHGRGRAERGAERPTARRRGCLPLPARRGTPARRGADDDSRRRLPGRGRRPAVCRVGGRRQADLGVQHRAGVRDRQQGRRRAAARLPRPARWSSTAWSTSARATRSAPARRAATCCWRSAWSSGVRAA